MVLCCSRLLINIIIVATIVLVSVVNSVSAFSSNRFLSTTTSSRLLSSTVLLSTTHNDNESQQKQTTTYPRLSRDEVEKWLGNIPVYAVTDSKGGNDDDAGVVLLKAKDGSNKAVANFFLCRETAENMLLQIKAVNQNSNLDITPFSLGMIWYEILNSELSEVSKLAGVEEEVIHRLVPDQKDLMEARKILSQSDVDDDDNKNAAEKKALMSKFQTDYDEVPIFMDLQIRVQQQAVDEDGNTMLQERFPMYLSHDDMMNTCQQFKDQMSSPSSSPSSLPPYEPTVVVTDLKVIIDQMRKPSDIDFRQSILIPATANLK